jgi:hypothetical protein
MLNVRYDMDQMLEAVHTPMPSRSPSPVSSDEESETATLFNPSPSPRLRSTRARLARKDSQMTMFSRSPTPLVDFKKESSPAPSSFSATLAVKVKVEREYTGPKRSRKRSGGGRDRVRRTSQNVQSQKTYRDKKVKSAQMVCLFRIIRSNFTDIQMGGTNIDIEVAVHANQFKSAEEKLEIVMAILRKSKAAMKGEFFIILFEINAEI